MQRQVKPERSGWRDEEISRRHRDWGVACSAFDVDFLLVECMYARPLALIEYKKQDAPDPTRAQLGALRTLATNAGIAFYVVWYTAGCTHFMVEPGNDKAWHLVRGGDPARTWWDEYTFVEFLHRIRGVSAPPDVLAGLYRNTYDLN